MFAELVQHIFLHILIHLEIGLVRNEETVLLLLYLLVTLVDGEVERCLQQSIFPRSIDVKLVIELSFLWHEVGDDGYCYNKNEAFVQQILI